jgi:hypothetical protein
MHPPSFADANWNWAKIARAPHTPLVRWIFEAFLAPGCPKTGCFPRKNGWQGAKPFGHGKGSNPEKVLKYSVNAPPISRSVSTVSSTPLRPFGADCTFQCNDSNIPRRYKSSRKLLTRGLEPPRPSRPPSGLILLGKMNTSKHD